MKDSLLSLDKTHKEQSHYSSVQYTRATHRWKFQQRPLGPIKQIYNEISPEESSAAAAAPRGAHKKSTKGVQTEQRYFYIPHYLTF
jgi:hypothetical protein